jgi:adenylate cyclase
MRRARGSDIHPPRWHRFARRHWPVIAAGLVGTLLCFSPAWRGIELRSFDWLVVQTAPGKVTLPITIVAIDEESMAVVGRQWPWPRSLHARVLDRLREAGAAVVAFDILFGEPSADPSEDVAFARSIANFHSVVLAANLEYRDTPASRQWVRIDPLPIFVAAGAAPGLATITTDRDGIQRRIPLSATAYWRTVLARLADGHPGMVARNDATEHERIRYLGGTGTFPYISYFRLLDPDRYLSANWKDALRDNIVLVGRTLQTSTELGAAVPDTFLTPLFSATGKLMPGAEIHANVIANMIAGETLYELPRGWAIALVAAAMLVVGVATRARHWLKAASLIVALIAVIALLEWWLFREHGAWLPGGAAMAAILVAHVGDVTAGFVAERARRRQLRRAFALYVAPAVVDEIVAHPERLGLHGRRREITLLFTDLAGFTHISEQLPAEEVAHLLNRHLTDMTDIVLQHGGTVDKFIGDAVMAFWGAPISDSEQSRHAVEAAMHMQASIAAMRTELVARGGPELRMRIGLHRGECIVGNLGGTGRFAYTAVGDCVNLASRVEGVNSAYGSSILLTQAVADAVSSRILLRVVDTVRVKGRSHSVTLFTPCDDAALLSRSARALEAYRLGKWSEAVALWAALATEYPDDPIAKVFLARLRQWARDGWPDAWDGVFTLQAK